MKEYFEAKTAQRWYNKKENYKKPCYVHLNFRWMNDVFLYKITSTQKTNNIFVKQSMMLWYREYNVFVGGFFQNNWKMNDTRI